MTEHGFRPCPICGRQIQTGHNLSSLNFDAHVEACPRQQSKKYLRQQRKAARLAAKAGIGSATLPGPGQLGFPFDGVPEEVSA